MQGNAKRLIEVARTEKDPVLKRKAVAAAVGHGLAGGHGVPAGDPGEVSTHARTLAIGAASLIAATLATAGPPANVTAGRVEERSAAAGLEPAIDAILREGGGPKWVGYAVGSNHDGSACCWSSLPEGSGCCGGCRLEGSRGDRAFRSGSKSPVRLEGPRAVQIVLRLDAGRIGRVQAYSPDCALDVDQLPFVWLEGVRPVESADLLASLLGTDRGSDPEAPDPERSVSDGALLALSMHAEPRAVDVLLKAARPPSPSRLRRQALFWLAQTASRKAGAGIREAVDDDPDVDVKKHAVFALSQLPPDEGVPHLIRVARTNAAREVRKQAMFWLGQSEDPRALAFFEEVLGR